MPLLVLLMCVILSHGEEAGLHVELAPHGPAAVRWAGRELLAAGSGFGVQLADAAGKQVKLQGDGGPRSEGGAVLRSWPGLNLRCTWKVEREVLRLVLEASNTGSVAYGAVTVQPLTIAFPRRPAGGRWWWGYDAMTGNDGDLGLIDADWGGGKVLFCCDEAEKPCLAGFAGNFGNSTVNALRLALAKGEQLPPGGERVWKVSLRFAASGTPSEAMAAGLYAAIAKAYPWQLRCDDRRPIGAIFLARDNAKWKTNPRGWFNDEKVDITTDAGRAAFAKRLGETADRCIAVIKDAGGQGMIFWDLEGAEMPHAITYLGDPRVLPQAAPEMETQADAFFKRFTDAGLKVGICIRPSRVLPNPKGGWMHQQVEDPVADMADKIAYAKKRWGCTIFYMDTNVVWKLRGPEDPTRGMWQGDASLLSSRQIHELVRRHPDVLIFPEFGRFAYYGACMPYGELHRDGGDRGVPAGVRAAWPRAGRTIKIGDGDYLGFWDDMLAGAVAGDIHVFRGWFGDTPNPFIRRCYQEADLVRAAAKPELAGADPAARYAAVAAMLKPDAMQVAQLVGRLAIETDWVVRRRIHVALGDSGLAAAVPPLVAAADDKTGLDGFAITALGRLGKPATSALGVLAAGGDANRRERALRALAAYEDPAKDAILLPLTSQQMARVRELATRALGAGNTPRLIELLEDPDKAVRRAAAQSLGRLKDPSAIEALVRVMQRAVTEWKDNDLRSDIGAALEAITGRQHGPFEGRWAKALKNGQLTTP
jgi:hypothetical protein